MSNATHPKYTDRVFRECNNPKCLSFNLTLCRKEDFDNCAYFKALLAAQVMKIK